MEPDVRGHGARCNCSDCKSYRKYGEYYSARVRREYAWALKRSAARLTRREARDTRARAWRLAEALAHNMYCQCQSASKWRQELAEAAYSTEVVQWDLEENPPEMKRFDEGSVDF